MRRVSGYLGLSGTDELIRFVPVLGVVIAWIVLMPLDGGFQPGDRLPAGIVMAALLGLGIFATSRVLPAGRHLRIVLGLLAAFTLLNFVSILWSDGRATGWEAADLLLVTLLSTWILALAPWNARSATLLVAVLGAAAVVVCLIELLVATSASDLTTYFDEFRFTPPLGYPNTTAAFAFMSAIPLLVLASRPDLSILAKTLSQGGATFLAAYALLPQSRGSVLGIGAALLVLFVLIPWRWRFAVHVGLLAGALLIAAGPVFDVYDIASSTGTASGALGDAATAIYLATAAGALAGLAAAVAERRVGTLEGGRARVARNAGIGAWVLVVLLVGAVGVARSAAISDVVGDQWNSLKNPGVQFSGDRYATGDRLTYFDPLERYDYWRVALDGFESNPLVGAGAGSFEHRYASERRFPKPSKYPHNLVMKTVGDNGIVGVLLMLGIAGAAAAGLLRRRSELTPATSAVVAAAVGVAAYFFAHGLFDWLEAYPVLSGPAVGFLVVALVVRARDRGEDDALPRSYAWMAPAAGVLLLAAAFALAAPWLAERYKNRGSEGWRANPSGAYADLRRAADWNPLSAEPLVLTGVIGLTRGDLQIAKQGFNDAIEREDTWLSQYGLALIAAKVGDAGEADDRLERALALNPKDINLPVVAKKIRKGGDLDIPALLEQALTTPNPARTKLS